MLSILLSNVYMHVPRARATCWRPATLPRWQLANTSSATPYHDNMFQNPNMGAYARTSALTAAAASAALWAANTAGMPETAA
jgi:hypothetical protein